ncbi:hypothetical protein B0T20DRAFT_496623 [Sordaria brevicollis]|uniref:RBR-type E3 ubiquitin transferase n=1 Tax=Sordaria brevicollis TaxID=83679 RepID=A0AAE0PHQ6_SORBR|nr:hypothetical protein B0T20DRAFT_496623 [Sordaria brevicollis]
MSLLYDVCPLGPLTSALSSRNLRGDERYHQGPSWRLLTAYLFPFKLPAMATQPINAQSQTQQLTPPKTEVSQLECLICTEVKTLIDFPSVKLSTNCKHEMRACLQCIRWAIAADLKNKHWQDIGCPDCGRSLDSETIVRYASPETRAKYEKILTRHMLESQEGFRWCAEPGCESGHIHEGGKQQPIMKCPMGHLTCYVHEVQWHKGMSCEEFDIYRKDPSSDAYQQHLRQLEENKKSEEKVAQTSKPCPSCGRNIEKNGGCAHMTCIKCSYQFCWECMADFKEILRTSNDAHRKDCRFHTDNLED